MTAFELDRFDPCYIVMVTLYWCTQMSLNVLIDNNKLQ